MDIKILVPGCTNCKNLETVTRTALTELGLDVAIDKVTDPGEIVSWGVHGEITAVATSTSPQS